MAISRPLARAPNFHDKVRYLVDRKFPGVRSLKATTDRVEKLSSEERADRIANADAYERELRSLPPEEVAKLYRQAQSQELADKKRREKLEAEHQERQRFYNQPQAQADFDHWSKAVYWTLEEAIALAFGKEPEVVNWKAVEPYRKASPFVMRYARVRDLARRAKNLDQITDPCLPGHFLAWAQRNDFSVPEALTQAVEARGTAIADWQALFEKADADRSDLMQALEEAQKLIDDLRASDAQTMAVLERARNELAAAKSSDGQLSTRERETLLKLIIGMAMKGYAYDPVSSRSATPREISDDLAAHGLAVSDDTVRKWLKVAAELLPRETE